MEEKGKAFKNMGLGIHGPIIGHFLIRHRFNYL